MLGWGLHSAATRCMRRIDCVVCNTLCLLYFLYILFTFKAIISCNLSKISAKTTTIPQPLIATCSIVVPSSIFMLGVFSCSAGHRQTRICRKQFIQLLKQITNSTETCSTKPSLRYFMTGLKRQPQRKWMLSFCVAFSFLFSLLQHLLFFLIFPLSSSTSAVRSATLEKKAQ